MQPLPDSPVFVRMGEHIVLRERIRLIDFTYLEQLHVSVHLSDDEDPIELFGNDTVDLIMHVCPAALEGKRLKFARRAWAIHNLVGHPLMQLLSFFGKTRAGLWVHDITIPRARCT